MTSLHRAGLLLAAALLLLLGTARPAGAQESLTRAELGCGPADPEEWSATIHEEETGRLLGGPYAPCDISGASAPCDAGYGCVFFVGSGEPGDYSGQPVTTTTGDVIVPEAGDGCALALCVEEGGRQCTSIECLAGETLSCPVVPLSRATYGCTIYNPPRCIAYECILTTSDLIEARGNFEIEYGGLVLCHKEAGDACSAAGDGDADLDGDVDSDADAPDMGRILLTGGGTASCACRAASHGRPLTPAVVCLVVAWAALLRRRRRR